MNAGIIGEPDGGEPDAMVGLAQKGPVIQRTRTIAPSSPQVENVFPSDSIVFIDASAGTIPLILSIPGVPSGQQFTVKRIDANQNTIVDIRDIVGATIDGQSNYLLVGQFSEVTIVADKEGIDPNKWKWRIVGEVRQQVVGQTTLVTGTTSVTVSDPATTATSNILLTPLSNPGGQLWVTRAGGSFTIQASAAPTSDVPITYLITN